MHGEKGLGKHSLSQSQISLGQLKIINKTVHEVLIKQKKKLFYFVNNRICIVMNIFFNIRYAWQALSELVKLNWIYNLCQPLLSSLSLTGKSIPWRRKVSPCFGRAASLSRPSTNVFLSKKNSGKGDSEGISRDIVKLDKDLRSGVVTRTWTNNGHCLYRAESGDSPNRRVCSLARMFDPASAANTCWLTFY